MTKLERKFEKIVVELHKRYSFLENISIDVVEGYGLKQATRYSPASRDINIDLKEIKNHYNVPRFIQRYGQRDTFAEFILVVLLHEIHHVYQHQTIPTSKFFGAVTNVDYDTVRGHDECWVEKEADKWAVLELPKVKNLLK